jgi:6-phosphofructokinase 1
MDMTDAIVETYHKHHLDALVCLGGGGTQRNAFRLVEKGLAVVTLPKTIDNDVAMTDVTFGFDTALGIATDATDRLHSTAHSHHRIIVVEVMGHNAGWLALGAGIAGGADVILIPEIPYDIEAVAGANRERSRTGSRFSIVAVSEGAMPREHARELEKAESALAEVKSMKKEDKRAATKRTKAKSRVAEIKARLGTRTLELSEQLETLTGLESRVTILGHLQRGGTPSAADRLLATRLGTACAALIHEGVFGVMVAARGDGTEPVPVGDVVGKRRTVPLDHSWVQTARDIGVSLGEG